MPVKQLVDFERDINMSTLPAGVPRNYLATVEQFFVALKDSGLTLSASDYHLIGQWEEAGIPVNLVCRAIENGLANFEKRNPRQADKVSLRYLKIYVDEEIERSRT